MFRVVCVGGGGGVEGIYFGNVRTMGAMRKHACDAVLLDSYES